jgi:hypothetical protein
MSMLHLIDRIVEIDRHNHVEARQIESACGPELASVPIASHIDRMTKADPTLAQIATRFTGFDVKQERGGYLIIDRRTMSPIARLRPIPDTDRFELFYWSDIKGRWTTFGNLRRMKLMLDSAREIVENDPMFRVSRRR